jgi:hypothetical protein
VVAEPRRTGKALYIGLGIGAAVILLLAIGYFSFWQKHEPADSPTSGNAMATSDSAPTSASVPAGASGAETPSVPPVSTGQGVSGASTSAALPITPEPGGQATPKTSLATKEHSREISAAIAQGDVCFDIRDYQCAADAYRKCLQIDPGNKPCQRKMHKAEEALDVLKSIQR